MEKHDKNMQDDPAIVYKARHAESVTISLDPIPTLAAFQSSLQLVNVKSRKIFVKVVKVRLPQQTPARSGSKPQYVSQYHWDYRYSLFSKYDEGIQLDEESWYSVTHEAIAEDIAASCGGAQTIMDGFAGVGGNVIQFARSSRVIAIEIDPVKVEMLRSNAKIYAVSDYIKTIVGNFFIEGPRQGPVDVLFMSPPWGGPYTSQAKNYDIFERIYPPITQIARTAASISRNIILYLPRNVDPWAVLSLFEYMPEISHKVEFRVYCLSNSVKTLAVLFGDFVHLDSLEVARALLNSSIDNSK